MSTSPTCFVIIGYGKKPSYANGKMRMLDLDETYTILIKPVFDDLGIPCYRAIDKNLSGSIDKFMLQEIKNADIALVDISTLNANVMWELGVRHALKSKHTIMICEKEQMSSIPFDINHFVIHQYTHSEEGIPFKEVERFRKHLSGVIEKLLNSDAAANDSPVFTFLEQELQNKGKIDVAENPTSAEDSFVSLLEKAEKAKNKGEFAAALQLFSMARTFAAENMSLKDNLSFIITRQALCTYKSKNPSELESLINARLILDVLNPKQSNDIEVLGISGAINKRLFDLTNDFLYLENAGTFYEKGFTIKQDYYNGINAAFILYKTAYVLKTRQQEWEDVKLKADYIRNSVLEIALKLESESGFEDKQDAIWVLLTIAEAYNYKGKSELMKKYEDKSKALAEKLNMAFAISSYEEQKKKIDDIRME